MIVDYKPEQYFSLTLNQPAVIIHDRFSRNEQADHLWNGKKIISGMEKTTTKGGTAF